MGEMGGREGRSGEETNDVRRNDDKTGRRETGSLFFVQ